MFTAQVTGTGPFNASVTWSVNGVNGGNSTFGTIVGGEYTAPATPPNPSSVAITATSVQNSYLFGTSTAIVYAPAVLTSITQGAASAGEQITINGQNLYGPTEVVFSGINGTSISMPLQQISYSEIKATVPFGTVTGPIYVNLTPFQGVNETTNTITLTRLPNLLVHASNKDLSSGETLQPDWRLLGANTPNVVNWKADSGSISAQGLFHAPVVSRESYSRVTGCVQNTNSCDTVLLRILPFRITPSSPIVDVGNTIQLDALQGGSFLSPQWSVLAGGGSIKSGGLFTAPTVVAQAGPVPVAATAGSTTEQTSVAVSGAFPGLVNRVYDYADFTVYTPPEETFVKAVAVSGNTAYALTSGAYYQPAPAPPYEALDVYDISNPDQPVWINAVEAASNYPADLFTYGNTLISLDSNYLIVYSLTSRVPAVTEILPVAQPWQWTMNNGVLYVLDYVPPDVIPPTLPIDLYNMSTGTLVHNHYDLPAPSSCGFVVCGISGNGNIVYISWLTDSDNTITFTIGTYDISQSPPSQLSTVVTSGGTGSESEYHLSVVGSLLFADSKVYDISNVTPVLTATLPLPLGAVWGVAGNSVLVSGSALLVPGNKFNYAVVDISSPMSPTVQANVPDLSNANIFNPSTATWASNGVFYAADGTGGFSVYSVSPSGGPLSATTYDPVFVYIYDQVIQQQTLYAAAVYGSGAGGLGCFDLSGDTPNLLGTLFYPNDSSFALQVSGTTVFLGLADSLKVVDASNPQSPVEIGSVAIPVNSLALSGNTLFAGTGDGRLVVFDVSTPASPKQIASVTMSAPSTMQLSGTLLLVAAGQSGLLVFGVSNPAAPAMLSQFSPSVSAPVWDVVQVAGSAVMLAADSSGVVMVDISNPSHPQQLYQQPLPYLNAFPSPSTGAGILPAFSLASQNGVTYVGTSAGIMFAFDATVPATPRLIAINFLGTDDTDVISVITPGTDNLYLAVQGVTTQLENAVPQNSIELYYPPAALSTTVSINDIVKHNGTTGNPKLEWMSRRTATSAHTPDRFGVMRNGRDNK
ncbi:MAG: PQQ-binding-like beta-propeller repeat protein [Thiobacillaceae bacterium]